MTILFVFDGCPFCLWHRRQELLRSSRCRQTTSSRCSSCGLDEFFDQGSTMFQWRPWWILDITWKSSYYRPQKPNGWVMWKNGDISHDPCFNMVLTIKLRFEPRNMVVGMEHLVIFLQWDIYMDILGWLSTTDGFSMWTFAAGCMLWFLPCLCHAFAMPLPCLCFSHTRTLGCGRD